MCEKVGRDAGAKQKVRRAAHMVVLKKSGARVKVLISGQDVQGCRKGLGCRSLAIIVAFFFKKSLESGMMDCRFFLGCRPLAIIAACLFFFFFTRILRATDG